MLFSEKWGTRKAFKIEIFRTFNIKCPPLICRFLGLDPDLVNVVIRAQAPVRDPRDGADASAVVVQLVVTAVVIGALNDQGQETPTSEKGKYCL